MRQSKTNQLDSMLKNLEDLHQETDQSQEQQCQLQFDHINQQSFNSSSHNSTKNRSKLQSKISGEQNKHQPSSFAAYNESVKKISGISTESMTKPGSPKNKFPKYTNNLGDYCRKSAESKWDTPSILKKKTIKDKQSIIPQESITNDLNKLKEINTKLFQDNKALMHECVKLRKMVYENQIPRFEVEKISFTQTLNKVRQENIRLKLELQPGKNENSKVFNQELFKSLNLIHQENSKISIRMKELERALEYLNKNSIMKHSDGFTLTNDESKYNYSNQNETDFKNDDMINSNITKTQKTSIHEYMDGQKLNSQTNPFRVKMNPGVYLRKCKSFDKTS